MPVFEQKLPTLDLQSIRDLTTIRDLHDFISRVLFRGQQRSRDKPYRIPAIMNVLGSGCRGGADVGALTEPPDPDLGWCDLATLLQEGDTGKSVIDQILIGLTTLVGAAGLARSALVVDQCEQWPSRRRAGSRKSREAFAPAQSTALAGYATSAVPPSVFFPGDEDAGHPLDPFAFPLFIKSDSRSGSSRTCTGEKGSNKEHRVRT
jgi:hypothetical protein